MQCSVAASNQDAVLTAVFKSPRIPLQRLYPAPDAALRQRSFEAPQSPFMAPAASSLWIEKNQSRFHAGNTLPH